MEPARLTRWRSRALYYGTHVGVAALVLVLLQHARHAPLRVPWGRCYSGDGLFFTALAKAVHESGPWHATHIGAPFGADLVDWPVGMWLTLATVHVLALVFPEPGTAANLGWMSTLIVAGACATYAFRRLRVRPGLAFVCGMLYGFLPYAFYRNVWHLNLVFPIVPLLGLLCLRLAGARPEDADRSERAILWATCVLQGLSYVYYTFFACVLLVPAALLGAARRRSTAPLRTGAVALLLLSGATALTLAPSLLYSRAHGSNLAIGYKTAAEADVYGLKLRHLLTPIDEHPLPPFAAAAAAAERAGFPGENENTTARLGTLGSLGLLGLLAFAVARAAGVRSGLEDDLDAAAALTLVALLVSQVGGLGSIFNLFVAPEIRAYNRIVVFVGFFALFAAAVLVSRGAAFLARGRRLSPIVTGAVLALVLAAGLFDQTPYRQNATPPAVVAEFEQDRAFVTAVEARLPAGAMIFQLPHGGIPFGPYEQARPYLHSRGLRWSWGAIAGRRNSWSEMVSRQPVEDTVRWATAAGFAGIWIDRGFYDGHKDWPHYEAVESAIAARPVGPAQVSGNGRYAFFPLEPYAHRIEAAVGTAAFARLRQEALDTLPVFRWMDGCGAEEPGADGWWRACGAAAHLLVRNPQANPLRVRLDGWFRAHDGGARRLVIVAGHARTTVALGAEASTWSGTLDLPAGLKDPLDLTVEGGAPCATGTTSCFDVRLVATPLTGAVAGPPATPESAGLL